MANDLFTKEDFIKKKPRNRWSKRVIFILLLIVAILTIIFSVKKCTTESQLPIDTIVVDSQNNNKNDSKASIDTLKLKDEIIDSVTTGDNQEPSIDNGKNVAVNRDTSKSTVLNLDEKVLSVIRGNYGNNPDRRRKLGAEYQIIQDKVNEMYRNGLVR